MRIICYTLFDITPTGIKSYYKKQSTLDETAWTTGRNQQRNWETLTQVLSLRTQLFEVESPTQFLGDVSSLFPEHRRARVWRCSFETEADGVFADDESPLGQLFTDVEGVPMIIGLAESESIGAQFESRGNKRNIYFEIEE